MAQVHSLTHVPVHSPFSEVHLPHARAFASSIYWESVARRNVLLRFSLACQSFFFRGVQRGYFFECTHGEVIN